MDRVSAMEMLARTPIICRSTRASMSALASLKRRPLTLIGPSSGKLIRPSRPTTRTKVRFWLP